MSSALAFFYPLSLFCREDYLHLAAIHLYIHNILRQGGLHADVRVIDPRNKKAKLSVIQRQPGYFVSQVTRPSLFEIRNFLSPPHDGFSFI